ncbi:SgcJ/EcaC family oxidoreductase (plasmid) [Rathayibacter sp. VKM Ac-2803]|uniref:YybH family protein n=1 Tax=Rathayibacter TaxID=33886 RepID=UPI001356DDF6|nr:MULTISPECIES: SgcJ/EcaC family oxidoreductase [Rathayibacter]MWV51432.1 SgcJ/EcaC family oxidoreductase [Rathayibacter sp. VKM Ac-2803]
MTAKERHRSPLGACLVRCHPEEVTENTAAAELRTLIDERVQAIASRDAQYLADAQDPEILAFNVLPPLRLRGSDQVAEQTRAWFDGYADGPGYEVHDLRIDVDGSVGATAFLYHVTGTLLSGDEVSMWVRATLVWKKIDGRWRIVHDHESIPWDPSTGQGLASLEP